MPPEGTQREAVVRPVRASSKPVRYRLPDEPPASLPRPSLLGRIDRALARLLVRTAARFYLRKPDVAELLTFKIRSLRGVHDAVRNELAFRRKSDRGYRLTSVNIEITNACNLGCTMCPVNTTMKRPKQMMPFDTFRRILDENPGLEFVLPFQWGEPMLHKDFYRIVAHARARGIPVLATTNGTFLESEEECERLARAGLERITFSSDGIGDTHTKIRGYSWEKLKANVEQFRRVRDRVGSTTRIDVSMVMMGETTADLERYRNAWRGIADRIQVIPLLTDGKREHACRELWRGSVVVLADGTVTTCCVDSEGELAIGHIDDGPLESVWNGPRMRELRRQHRSQSFPGPCASCDEYEHDAVSKRFQ